MNKIIALGAGALALAMVAPGLGLAAADDKPTFEALKNIQVSVVSDSMTEKDLAAVEGSQFTITFGDFTNSTAIVVGQTGALAQSTVTLNYTVTAPPVTPAL